MFRSELVKDWITGSSSASACSPVGSLTTCQAVIQLRARGAALASATNLELNDLAFLCFLVHDLHDRDFLHDLASLGRATDFHGSWSTDRCVVFTFFRAVSLDGLILRFAPARGFADV